MKKRKGLSSKWICDVNTNINKYKSPHEFEFLGTQVDMIRYIGDLGLKDIVVEIIDIFYCKFCLEQRFILREKENLMNYPNWHARMKHYSIKYRGNINDYIINVSTRNSNKSNIG